MNPSPRRAKKLDGRTAAVRAVNDALSGRRFVNEALREIRTTAGLDGREAGLAMEIAQGTVRHVLTIEHVLGAVARFRRERTAPQLRAILYTAAYQIIWMDRVPPFAAVDQAVRLARELVRGRAPAMVNAVLRRLAGAIKQRRTRWQRLDPTYVRVGWDQACQFDRAVLPPPGDDNAAHLAAATGERSARYTELVANHGCDAAESTAWAAQALPATILQRNPCRATPTAFEQALRTALGPALEIVGDVAFAPPSAPLIDTPAFQDGLVYVQDTTAHTATVAVEAQRGQRILDLCAAPGGKSLALALAMEDWGQVLACDADPQRLALVDTNVLRLGLTCVRTHVLQPERDHLLTGGPPFDAALVDVPCSNTGVIARRPEARLGFTPAKLRSLVQLQRGLLRRAAACVRPGGRLVYSTCSIEPAENEQVVAEFLAENRAWRLEQQVTTLPAWGPRWSDWRDGGYFARLVRTV